VSLSFYFSPICHLTVIMHSLHGLWDCFRFLAQNERKIRTSNVSSIHAVFILDVPDIQSWSASFFGLGVLWRDLLPNSFYTENIGFLLKVIVSFYKLEALRTAKVKSFNTYKSQEKGKMLTVIKLNIIWCRTWRFKYRDEVLRPSMCHLNGQQQCRRPSLSSPSHQE
jgi:hypothetical protein